MSRTRHAAIALAPLLLLLVTPPAPAQRLSLADRMAALEQRVANTQANVQLLNQLAQLRSEMQALRSQVEELQQANETAGALAKTRYLDIDSRLERLEGGTAAGPAKTAPVLPPPADAAAATPPVRAAARATAPAAPTAGSATPTGAELAAYNVAFDALKMGRYADASRLFTAFLDGYPGGVYTPNAFYWLGESYYATRNYALALQQFEQLLDRFPTHDKAAGALLKIGLTHLGLQQEDAARAAFAGVVSRYPGTDAARSANDRLQAMRARP
ncbi:MAG: tol-pal system protein YbgF [Lysobacter sp.]|nr:MAG: tol-pal system protein YbgF [Lysobacter sp.]